MIEIFLKTLPFFAVIGLGYAAARVSFFSQEANAHLTKFVFYFALSAMIFSFSSQLSFGQVLRWDFILAYLLGSGVIYALATAVALWRGTGAQIAAVEAQCAVIGNVGFLGLPMLSLLLGPEAVIWNMIVLAIDLIIFGSLIVIIITGARDGRVSIAVLGTVGMGLLKNPMIMAMVAGLAWSATGITLPGPGQEFVTLLGAAATPCALFAIGASLASKSAERVAISVWLTVCKLFLHPAAVAIAALWVFSVDAYAAGVMIAAAALPVAGNIYIIAHHYGVAPARVSAAILISTALSVATLSGVIAMVLGW